jgi:DNA-3-methyladenine glycosylase II
MPVTLETLQKGVEALTVVDPDLGEIYQQYGLPPLWRREPGFTTLVAIILEQQVSLASARAAFCKLQSALTVVTPEAFLTLSDEELKIIGFSRQKASYCRGLAEAVLSDSLNLEGLSALDDRAAREELCKIRGIGTWSAEIYLLMALLRQDIWPYGDLALLNSVQEIKKLVKKPNRDESERISNPWKPWRSIAARLFWHYYLSSERLS